MASFYLYTIEKLSEINSIYTHKCKGGVNYLFSFVCIPYLIRRVFFFSMLNVFKKGGLISILRISGFYFILTPGLMVSLSYWIYSIVNADAIFIQLKKIILFRI